MNGHLPKHDHTDEIGYCHEILPPSRDASHDTLPIHHMDTGVNPAFMSSPRQTSMGELYELLKNAGERAVFSDLYPER